MAAEPIGMWPASRSYMMAHQQVVVVAFKKKTSGSGGQDSWVPIVVSGGDRSDRTWRDRGHWERWGMAECCLIRQCGRMEIRRGRE